MITRLSEDTLVITCEQTISDENFEYIHTLHPVITTELSAFIVDTIPSYASIHITFDILHISFEDIKSQLMTLIDNTERVSTHTQRTLVRVPVCYSDEYAPDLALLAKSKGFSSDEVIRIHTSTSYKAYALGFAPGFAYLGQVDERIQMPRKTTPRTHINAGSVGIANAQTAVYPSASPGGWQIIGRTPMQMVDYNRETLSTIAPGDTVLFYAITKEEYLRYIQYT